jgi:hypothetical protein
MSLPRKRVVCAVLMSEYDGTRHIQTASYETAYWYRLPIIHRDLSDEIFAPRQQREQLNHEIGNHEGCEGDRRYAQKRILN